MPSLAGSRLGHYEIIALLGRGGMGEVYRARDVRLGRDVALKVISEDGAGDPARRQRVEREARALASLNHPNIAAIHGIEETRSGPGSPATTAIVMELVEGETLAERLRRGPLPLDDALRLGGQIAEALDEAHQRGIVHRDLKPANIKITSSGTVKVLDFGLAKMLADPSHAEPTVTNLTSAAAVVGTAAYMAPEQAQGRPVDTRADIWAFGVVLYETITGTRLFQGDSFHTTLAAVLSADVDLSAVPAPARRLLRACLERDVAKRLRDIGDARFLLSEPSPADKPSARRQWPLLMSASAAAGLIGVLAGTQLTPDPPPSPRSPVRLSTVLPEGANVTRGPGYTSSVAVSPDGRTVIIAATDGQGQRLYRRSLDRIDPVPIDGTEGATSPFFSRNGDWIGFFAHGRLKRIPAAGGASVDIAEVPVFSSGATWGPDDRIIFAYGADARLLVVPAAGGTVEVLLKDRMGRQPEVLPGGRRVLFESAGRICVLDLDSGVVTQLIEGTAPRYTEGRLLFSRSSTLLAAPFDPEDSSIGTAVPLFDGVAVELPGSGGGRHYAVARAGALAYVPAPQAYELALIGAGGTHKTIGQPQRSFENPRFSPDGTEVVVGVRRRDDEPTDLWLHDLRSGASTRLTTDGGRAPVWSGDRRVTYSHLGQEQGIYTLATDGGARQRVVALEAFHWLVGWTPDQSTLVFGQMQGNQKSSILTFRDGATATVVGPGSTWGGRLSRDGKWLAYYVLESGRFEIYVNPWGGRGARWLIGEGTDPSWAPDGSELYYRSGARLVAARLDKSSGVRVVTTRVVVDPFLPPLYDDYDIHPDGRSVVIVRPVHATYGREVAVAFDWTSELPSAGSR
jgi:serine/threonine protein kinase/Tol biopolymer transport system component